jgi:hypothetical protein
MKLGTRITLRFVVFGFFIITAIFLGDRRTHSESLYSIKPLNKKLNGAVKESFVYVVSGDT